MSCVYAHALAVCPYVYISNPIYLKVFIFIIAVPLRIGHMHLSDRIACSGVDGEEVEDISSVRMRQSAICRVVGRVHRYGRGEVEIVILYWCFVGLRGG